MTLNKILLIITLSFLSSVIFVSGRDFYIGMFMKNDILAAQDTLYRERVPYHRTVAKYLKVVRCPITYLRVLDRLGVEPGPNVRIVRGGLKKNHIYLYITSVYNHPLAVNIYIGCPKAKPTTTAKPADAKESNGTDVTGSGSGDDTATVADEAKPDGAANEGAGDATTAAEGAAEGEAAGEGDQEAPAPEGEAES